MACNILAHDWRDLHGIRVEIAGAGVGAIGLGLGGAA